MLGSQIVVHDFRGRPPCGVQTFECANSLTQNPSSGQSNEVIEPPEIPNVVAEIIEVSAYGSTTPHRHLKTP